MAQQNQMKEVRIEKVTLNIGAGNDQEKLNRGVQLLEHITGIEPVKTYAKERVPSWDIRPGLPIGCKITLRGEQARELLPNLLEAKDDKLPASSFDDHGNVSFGIQEYIDVGDVEYDPEIGMMGFQVCITLERPGYRVEDRKVNSSKVASKHKVDQDAAIEFFEEEFDVEVEY